jgi:serine/threonine-protein kinase
MGVVYKGRDPLLQRTVAIKEILAAGLSGDDLARYKQRFFREAEVAARLQHPDIVTIHDVGEDQTSGQPYLVMEFVEGRTVEALLAEAGGPLPLPQSLRIACSIATALDYAHRKGVVHRDIKPANIIVRPDGGAEIMDLGIARLEGSQITKPGQVLGTPAYMSPEQLTGAGVDGRADIFSLGAVLYEMLTGEVAFTGETLTEVILKIIQCAPAPALELNAQLPPDVDRVLSMCLAKDPAERYQSAGELAADLETVREKGSVAA